MENEELVRKANEIVAPYGLTAEIISGAFSVGVQGDGRTYLPVMVLKGPHPGWKIIEVLSTEIPNTLPVNRVTYDVTLGSGFVASRFLGALKRKKFYLAFSFGLALWFLYYTAGTIFPSAKLPERIAGSLVASLFVILVVTLVIEWVVDPFIAKMERVRKRVMP